MQNFLPCKNSPQNHCDVSGANGVIYEDLTNIHLRSNQLPTVSQPSIEVSFFSAGTLAKTLLHTRLSISLSPHVAPGRVRGGGWVVNVCMYVRVKERERKKWSGSAVSQAVGALAS
jgi:hypothetical protein